MNTTRHASKELRSVCKTSLLTQGGSATFVEGTDLLVATRRTPNTEGIGLEVAGVELTDKGYIKVNERLQTTAPGVWAIGGAREALSSA